MIEGSEELKAYIYEAAQFPRVDLEMFETHTYHAIYMNTPMMWNWTKTHGGPYYVEVGKNVKVDYVTRENVTTVITHEAPPVTNVNGTNDTNTTTAAAPTYSNYTSE